MKKILLIFSIFSVQEIYAQREIIFDYDEAGNQIYRGEKNDLKTLGDDQNFIEPIVTINDKVSEEEVKFWQGVKLAPVPVKDVLTIQINQEIKDILEEIIVTDMLGNLQYIKKNTSLSFLQTEINMHSYIEGVYIIRFNLKNGKFYSQSILKH